MPLLYLYYFTSQQYALESLRDKRIKVARFSELNDPFDFLGLAADLPSQRSDLNKLRDITDKKFGIICMSATWQEPLLWGHYADKHKGICIEFEVDGEKWQKIRYRAERPKISDYGVDRISALSMDQLEEINRTKFRAWSYERERRLFVELKDPDPVTGLYFHPFGKGFDPVRIILGHRSTASKETIERLCELNGGRIDVIRARPAFRDFRVVRAHDSEWSQT